MVLRVITSFNFCHEGRDEAYEEDCDLSLDNQKVLLRILSDDDY